MATLRKGWQQVPNQGLHYFRVAQRLSTCAGIVRDARPVQVLDQPGGDTSPCKTCHVIFDEDQAKKQQTRRAGKAQAKETAVTPVVSEAP